MTDTEKLDAMRLNGEPADRWVAANDAVDEAALAIEIEDGLVLGNTQRRAMLSATLRAIARATPKDEARPDFAGTLRTLLAIVIELHEYAYNGGDEVSRRCLALRDTMAAAIVAFEETARRAPKDEAARLHEWANALLGLPDSMVLPAVQQARLQWPANRANGTADAGGTSGAGHSAAPVNEPHSVAGHSQRVPEDEAAPTVTGIPDDIADLVRSAFVAGMDRCREVREAYDEWPSLTGRVELADDYISTFTLLGPEPTEAEASATLDQADGEGARTVNRTATTGRQDGSV